MGCKNKGSVNRLEVEIVQLIPGELYMSESHKSPDIIWGRSGLGSEKLTPQFSLALRLDQPPQSRRNQVTQYRTVISSSHDVIIALK